MKIIERINRRIKSILESTDPYSEDYDRQEAEDILYHTIGPLTDNPRWVDGPWTSPGDPPSNFVPGGPAPKWTREEVAFAMGGDPKLLFRAKENPRSPGYGNKGGAPIFRMARKIASIYNRRNDKSFIEDLYQNGHVQLANAMRPGADEGKSPFISYALRTIESAMGHGTGGSTEGIRAGGEASTYFITDTGHIKNRLPQGTTEIPKGWKKISATGLKGILKLKNPKQIRNAAEVVKGKYQTQRSSDKHPDNPFGVHSSAYYRVVNNYADAVESGDQERIESATNQINQVLDDIEQSETPIRGASTGLGSAISTLDRAVKDGAGQQLGIQSMDVPMDDGGTAAGNIADPYSQEELDVDPEALNYVLDLSLNYDLGNLLKSSKKWTRRAVEVANEELMGEIENIRREVESLRSTEGGDDKRLKDREAKLKVKEAKLKKEFKTGYPIGGRLTPQEFRFILRYLGPIGMYYPGKGTVRKNLDVPRDGKIGSKNWLEPGEDPEIEPLPEGGLWHSIWSRKNYRRMGPTDIANEMTLETMEFNKLGIKSARGDKVRAGSDAISKVAASRTMISAKVKLTILAEIHKDQLGMESIIYNKFPLLESMDAVDRNVIASTCESIVKIINFMERKPVELNGTVRESYALKKKNINYEVGPGGHIPDGTGPHGRGKGPGKGKSDCPKKSTTEKSINLKVHKPSNESISYGMKPVNTILEVDGFQHDNTLSNQFGKSPPPPPSKRTDNSENKTVQDLLQAIQDSGGLEEFNKYRKGLNTPPIEDLKRKQEANKNRAKLGQKLQGIQNRYSAGQEKWANG